MTESNGKASNGSNGAQVGTVRVKQGLAQMLKGGVIVSIHQNEKQEDRKNSALCPD